MQFLRENQGAATQAIAGRICQELFDGKRVLWLVSGGSNVATEVAVMELLHVHCEDRLDGLAILPIDERYGVPGHADSNTQQLRIAGFDPGAATWVDILLHNIPFDQTVEFYNEVAATALANAGAVIAQIGLGTDGHVAGVLPGSPAAQADEATVAGYGWRDYSRLTLTPMALRAVTVAYVLAYGREKKRALHRLHEQREPLAKLPAVLLCQLPEVYIYNDAISSEGA